MDYLPMFLDVRHRDVLVVGGGTVAARKCNLLLRAGATVTVVAPTLCGTLAKMVTAGRLLYFARPFESGDVQGMVAVVAATGDAAVNRDAAAAAARAHVPVNVVDDPTLSSFIFPAIVDRSPLVIALSSGGTAPVLVRSLRERLESLIPHGYGRLAAFAGGLRKTVSRRIVDPLHRRRFWEELFDGPIGDDVLAGDEERATQRAAALLDDRLARETGGEVWLVGAGPGDPDLLTFKALRLMQRCDVVLHDRLVSGAVLDLVRREAERIDVGKRCGDHVMTQDEIGALMVRLALDGKRVLRLKGGDPFMFGRGGEEAALMAQHGIVTRIVPGITAAGGCAAYGGIPLTHRDHAQSCVFITGHGKGGVPDQDWAALAKPGQTVVIYMGLSNADAIAGALIRHGAPHSRPVALIADGTRPDQHVVITTLGNLPMAAREMSIRIPTLLVIGDVVSLAREDRQAVQPAAVGRRISADAIR